IYEFDPFLGAYPLLPPDSTYPAWLKLSDHIKQSTVSSVFVAEGFVDSYDDQIEEELSKAQQTLDRQQKAEAAQAAQNDKNSESSTSQKRTTDTILEESEDTMEVEQPSTASGSSKSAPAKRELVKRSTTVKFTPINLRASFRKGAVGEEVTRYSLDKSWLLNHLFTSAYHSDVSRFLGEYQAAFTTMLLCYHLGAFRQWKAMTILVCQSAEATPSPNFTNFFVAFIKTLDSQLASIPSSFFTDLLFASSDEADITANFVEISLKSLGRNILSGLRHGHCAELRKPMRQLQKSVMETFEWKISGDFKKASTKVVEIDVNNVPLMSDDDEYEEEGEYAPVIVE
ncbi:a1-alpha2 repression, partial [Lunasporangiospora selenospora]